MQNIFKIALNAAANSALAWDRSSPCRINWNCKRSNCSYTNRNIPHFDSTPGD